MIYNNLLSYSFQSLFDSSSLSDANLLEWSHAANPLNSSTENNLSELLFIFLIYGSFHDTSHNLNSLFLSSIISSTGDDILSLSLLASLSPNAAGTFLNLQIDVSKIAANYA